MTCWYLIFIIVYILLEFKLESMPVKQRRNPKDL